MRDRWHVGAWVVLALLSSGCSAQGVSASLRPVGAAPSEATFLVDADNCLRPESGHYNPHRSFEYSTALRRSLFPDPLGGNELVVHVHPSFERPSVVRVVKTRDGDYRVAVTRTMDQPWQAMMLVLGQQHGDEIEMSEQNMRTALAQVSVRTESFEAPLPAELARSLVALSRRLLQNVQYPRERFELDDGRKLASTTSDGVRHHVWSANMSGQTHSPREGSLLDDYVDVVNGLARYATGPADARSELARQLRDRAAALRRRARRRESCVMPLAPGR